MSLKTWWSSKNIMLRVGITLTLIYFIVSMIGVFSMMYFNGFSISNFWIIFLYFPAAFALAFLVNSPFIFFLLCVLINLLIYFLIGSLIGWIIWKIKNKKQKNEKSKNDETKSSNKKTRK